MSFISWETLSRPSRADSLHLGSRPKPALMSAVTPPHSTACSPNRSVSVSFLNVVSMTPARAPPMPHAYDSAHIRLTDASWFTQVRRHARLSVNTRRTTGTLARSRPRRPSAGGSIAEMDVEAVRERQRVAGFEMRAMSSYVAVWPSSGVRIAMKSASSAASATPSPEYPLGFGHERERLAHTTRTSTPESSRLSAWAYPGRRSR